MFMNRKSNDHSHGILKRKQNDKKVKKMGFGNEILTH